ncbi:serine/threonine-protein kinase Nek7-like [Arctopsyche grandis]|uniref:serine/threonine-protein kinase Nek7-like n=1 Tax=Arctopsyche grandis TaxID=121162 RepID=UPI00406DA1AF
MEDEIITNLTNENKKYCNVEKFIFEKRIGRGQFSEVYRVTSVDDGRLVAVKKIHFYDMVDASARMDCLKEINLLQQLVHVNIISYLGSFISDSQLHIVLELADAGDLARLIRNFRKRNKLILERTIWKYFVQICAAIDHMHSKRIMHRDIKPANVFITSDGVVKMGDLGLGRFFSHKTVAAHSLVGTPYYMSPERVKEKGYNFQSDIWSMGCLLYEMAALKSPFYGDKLNLFALIRKIENCDYDNLPAYAYSTKYRNLVDVCIRAEPSERPNITYLYDIASERHSYWCQQTVDEAVSTSSSSSGKYSKAPSYI